MTETELSTAHPLFSLDEAADPDAECPEVHHVTVTRWEAGQKFTAPRMFQQHELRSLDELFALYGGGKYELIGRGADNSRIVARRTYILPGESKPLFETIGKAKTAEPDMRAVLAAMMQAQQAAPSSTNLQTIIALLGVLAPVIGQWLQNQSAQSQAALLAQQNLMATVMTTATQSSDKLVTAMAQIYNARPAGSGGGSFQDGMQFMQDFITGQAEGKTEGDGEPSIKDIVALGQAYLESQRTPVIAPAAGSNGAAS